MKLPAFLLVGVWVTAAAAAAQVQMVSESYFPANLEFAEMHPTTSEETFEDPARLSKIDSGRLFADVGFDKYARRDYSVGTSGSLSVEVVTLRDARAAYSALTLLRGSDIQDGPPGDFFTAATDGMRFAQGREWVRIQGRDIPGDLLKRVASSVSNRIGSGRQKAPSLISHLPKLGYDARSLRYFPGMKAYRSYAGGATAEYLKPNSDAEMAQARYSLDDRAGMLFLLSFPTAQVAEEYFANLAGPQSAEKHGNGLYAKRAGPLVAILDGSFDPSSADRILSSIRFSYSVRWIYEKRVKPTIIWGVPTGILGTVVGSLFFVVLLCGVSMLAGVGFAVVRFVLRGYASDNSPDRLEQTEITQLRLR